MTKLQSLRFDDERWGFPFDKYVALHVQGHVEHDNLQQYGVVLLTNALKILWFQNGITDKSLDAVRASINANPTSFTTFSAVQEAYVSFKLQQKQIDPPSGCQVSSLRGGRRSGGPRGGGDRSSGVFSEEELAACKVINRHYSKVEYNKLTPLQQQKLYQLRHTDQKLGTGPTRQSCRGGTSDSASIASTNTSAKRTHEDSCGDTEEGDDQDQTTWGHNCDMSPVAGRQRTKQKTNKKDE